MVYRSLLTIYVNPVFPIMILLIFKITQTHICIYTIYMFLFYVNECFAYMFVGALHLFLMLLEARKGHIIPWSSKSMWL